MICDSCWGSGKESFYVYEDGSPVWLTSDMEVNELIEQAKDEWETEDRPCSTCDGTGVMPKWLALFYARHYEDEQDWDLGPFFPLVNG